MNFSEILSFERLRDTYIYTINFIGNGKKLSPDMCTY